MRIALFSGNYNYVREGANQALNRLVRYLEDDAGHCVRVYSPVTDTPAFEPAGTLVPIRSVALPVRSEFRLALGLPSVVRRDIKAFSPDLVHVSTPDILGTRAQTFARQLGVPVVASLHTRFETYLEHYGLGFARRGLEAHLRRFYRRSNCVLVPTATLLEEMIRIRGDDQVKVWSRGVDRSLFNPRKRDLEWRRGQGWSDEEIVVLFLGRLVAEKGVSTYADVVRALQRAGLNIRPLIVGAGPFSGPFKELSGAVLTGHLDDAELARAIASADIMFNPSTTEAFGNVVLEAMASGLPVVSADAASASALIADGQTGLLRSSKHLDGFVEAMRRLIASPRERKSMGTAARAASKAYSWNEASRCVELAYQDVLQARLLTE